MRISKSLALAVATFGIQAAIGFGQQSELGSTATLEWIQGANRREASAGGVIPSEQNLQQMTASWAREPVPAFKYRFWPSRTSLKPGSAQTHFYRAVVNQYAAMQQLPKEQLQQLSSLQGLEIEKIPIDEARQWVDRFEIIYSELDAMARSEDTQWDLRFRDLRGTDIWAIRLEDVQQARGLARLLTMKIATQIAKKDFAGAAESIAIGFRLAALVGQGESLVQSLVGLAIENTMYAAVDYAIRSKDCPSFYWALRTLPDRLTRLDEALEVELEMAPRTLTLLDETEVLSLSDREITQRLTKGLTDLKQLLGSDNSVGPTETLGWLLTATGSEAKRKLQTLGYASEKLDRMSDLQASLILAGREMKIQSDQLLKSSKVRDARGLRVGDRTAAQFDQWLRENRASVSGVIASLLFPAVNAAQSADLRTRMIRNRLMIAEALRLHAQSHQGQLPASLDELVDTPAPLDPFSDKPFEYRFEKTAEGQVVTLSSAASGVHESMKSFTITLPSAIQ